MQGVSRTMVLGSAALICALGLMAGTANAGPAARNDPNANSTTIAISGVNFNEAREVEALYAMLNRAAHRVCAVQDKYTLEVVRETKACQQRALDEAVQDINRLTLTARHQSGAQATAEAATGAPRS